MLSQGIGVHGSGAQPAPSGARPGPAGTRPGTSTVRLQAGLIAAPGGRYVADLSIRDGWITAVGSTGTAAERVIDGMGRVVLPGWVLPLVPADAAATPPHERWAGAGITCAGWPGAEPREAWGSDVARMEPIGAAEQIARAPVTIHERGRVAFVLPAGRGAALLDAAARMLARLRATLIIAVDGEERVAAAAAERAAACGGRVAVGPLRQKPLLRRVRDAGALAATDPAWLIEDPSLWREAARGTVRLLMSASRRPPPLDALYRSGPARGLIGLEALAALLAATPAALLGCAAKGLLAPGREADLCLLEPSGGGAEIVTTLLRGADARRPHGRVIRCEPVDGLPAG